VASHGDAPPTGVWFCVPHKRRMWWLRTNAFPRRAWFSDPGDADSVYVDRNYVECLDTDPQSLGDQIMGGMGEYDGMLIIWCRDSVWRVSGTGTVINTGSVSVLDWTVKRTDAKAGVVSHRAAIKVPKGAVYLNSQGGVEETPKNMVAYLSSQKDIRLFDGNNDYVISDPKGDTLAGMNMDQAHKSYCYDDEARSMLVWVFAEGALSEPSTAVAWNYKTGTWHEFEGFSFGHIVQGESTAQVKMLLAGHARTSTGAIIYQLWNGNDRDGAVITHTLMTKALYPPIIEGGLPDIRHEKRMMDAFLLFDKDATPVTVTVGVLPHDAADADALSITRTVSGTSVKKVPLRQLAAGANPGRYFHGPGLRLKITSSGIAGPWGLAAIDLAYQPLTGHTRTPVSG
jgi:hypothetical protein